MVANRGTELNYKQNSVVFQVEVLWLTAKEVKVFAKNEKAFKCSENKIYFKILLAN